MILIDANQLMIANMFSIYGKRLDEIQKHHVRYAYTRGMAYYYKRFHEDYGDLVLCYDHRASWRRDYYPYYKASRRRDQKKSSMDWGNMYDLFMELYDEILDEVNVRSYLVHGCEADDVIGYLCNKAEEKTVIVSSDKDFKQLNHLHWVDQYSPAHKEFLVCEDTDSFLQEHIIRGDSSDGIPNVYSDDDAIVNEAKKQTIMNKKRYNAAVDMIEMGDMTSIESHYHRNKTLIDLNEIPSRHKGLIRSQHQIYNTLHKDQSELFEREFIDYLKKHSLYKVIEEMMTPPTLSFEN